MRHIAALVLSTLLAAAVVAGTGCAAVRRGPPVRDTVIDFESADALDDWVLTGGEWRVEGDRLIGHSIDPSGNVTNEFATYGTFFGEIERVIVRGGLRDGSPHNFRMAVGAALQLFNWELADANWFRIGHHESRVEGAALVPGREHEIVVEQVGERVRVVVDERLLWERPGRLHGTIALHPMFGSSLWVREITVRGRAVPWVAVRGPAYPGF